MVLVLAAEIWAAESGNTLRRSFCCCLLRVDCLPSQRPCLNVARSSNQASRVNAWARDGGGAFCQMYHCQTEVRRSKFLFLLLAGSNMVETSPPFGFCCHFYKGTIVLLYNGMGGKGQSGSDSSEQEDQLCRMLVILLFSQASIVIWKAGAERRERDVISKTDCFFLLSFPLSE